MIKRNIVIALSILIVLFIITPYLFKEKQIVGFISNFTEMEAPVKIFINDKIVLDTIIFRSSFPEVAFVKKTNSLNKVRIRMESEQLKIDKMFTLNPLTQKWCIISVYDQLDYLEDPTNVDID